MSVFLEIIALHGREILDSRGNPTVEAELVVENHTDRRLYTGRASVPSGASTGVYEALELRDNDLRYLGRGVQSAVKHINETIAPFLLGRNAFYTEQIDGLLLELDGTPNKAKLGANGMLAVSLACARAGANALHMPLYRYLGGLGTKTEPLPLMNIINGGRHAKNNLDFQEFMILPMGAGSFREALRMGVEVYHRLRQVLERKGLSTGVGDEGGFAPMLQDAREALILLNEAVELAGYKPGKDIAYAMDAAASELYNPDGGCYYFDGETKMRCQQLKHSGKKEPDDKNNESDCLLQQTIQPDAVCARITRTTEKMIEYYESLVQEFPLVSIEDGLDQNDWEGWSELTKRLGKRIQLVGDDLFVTNVERLREGIRRGCGNAILIKPNQIGTLSETLEAIRVAGAHGYKTIISHRSGETEDSFIADLAVAVNAGQIKTGAPCRSERVAKYNRLTRIEEELAKSKEAEADIPFR